jgi:hypothetical protein
VRDYFEVAEEGVVIGGAEEKSQGFRDGGGDISGYGEDVEF